MNSAKTGSLAKFVMNNHEVVTDWVDKSYWGKGFATLALKDFLRTEPARPIDGRVAFEYSARSGFWHPVGSYQ